MRLWHQALIHYLPRQQLLGQHRECCALRGKGWGKKHSVVDYVFKHDIAHLYQYHMLVISEMLDRNYNVDTHWFSRTYRGKDLDDDTIHNVGTYCWHPNEIIYSEHDDNYLKECLDNLEAKGAELVNSESIAHMQLCLAIRGV